MTSRTLFFICTGNYYRSRFSEEVFNHRARTQGLDWCARSGGLKAAEFRSTNPGTISVFALSALHALGISPVRARCEPYQLTARDIAGASVTIAMDGREHRRMVEELFRELAPAVRYWDVGDVDVEAPPKATARMVTLVDALIKELTA